jgi:hypothetical protein
LRGRGAAARPIRPAGRIVEGAVERVRPKMMTVTASMHASDTRYDRAVLIGAVQRGQSQNLPHWSILGDWRVSLRTWQELKRFHGQENGCPSVDATGTEPAGYRPKRPKFVPTDVAPRPRFGIPSRFRPDEEWPSYQGREGGRVSD